MAKEDKGKSNYRMEVWMKDAIRDIAAKSGATETQVVVNVLEERLEALGYKSPLRALLAKALARCWGA